ncbi:unnamed protein product [Cylicostephanus goldi]|uniref:Uncharacterized protein n=1 Tax=Cylicostephanus goldi TaxID=71465 RepID=A0A3P6RSD6_CYLGO|nr:unnamed protein product [Cylicostephanus goldi]
MLWARAVDWSLGNIENVAGELRDEFEKWFYFAISCPVEGGRAFDSIKNALKARNYTLAAHMIGIVGSFTQKCTDIDYAAIDPEHELVFDWTSALMKHTPMEA